MRYLKSTSLRIFSEGLQFHSPGLVIFWLLQSAESQGCRPQEYTLQSEARYINITSPNYPYPYQPGTNCRYRIVAPLDHIVELECRFLVSPDTCQTEFFYVSSDGDYQFRDSANFCRSGLIRRFSNFRAIAFAYYSTSAGTNQRGLFQCRVMARRQGCTCGWSSPMRITNGQEAMKHEFPSIVALKDIRSQQRVFCGGSIVSHRHIVTAAHCMSSHVQSPSNIIAFAGDHDLTSTTESLYAAQYRIQRIIVHPRYNMNSISAENDIAVLVSRTMIEWSKGVGPVCLPFRQLSEEFSYLNVDIAGWGSTSFAGSKSATLQKARLITMANSACQQRYNTTILRSHICTYDFLGVGSDSCQFDSGGPVIFHQQQHLLIGVISYGQACGLPYSIGVNTRVTSHMNWLWQQIRENACLV